MVQAAAKILPPGWQARLELGFARRGPRTELVHRRRHRPLAVQRPFHPDGDTCHVYLLHPPGGVVGGDRLDISVDVQPDASALITTPGATKFYRSTGPVAHQLQMLSIGENASLEWFPQENILFPGACVVVGTRIDLRASSRFIGWELHCLGRPVVGESFNRGCADFSFALYRDGVPLQLERLRIQQESDLAAAAKLRGNPVIGSLCATGADRKLLEQVREISPARQFGATLVDDLLLLRYLGSSTEQARNTFIQVWAAIRESVVGKPACPPRIWST